MNIRKITAVIMAALIIASFSACGSDKTSNNSTSEPVNLLDTAEMFSSKDIETGYDESECTVITLTGNSASIKGKGASVKGSVITISSEGDYIISGKLDSGCITIDAVMYGDRPTSRIEKFVRPPPEMRLIKPPKSVPLIKLSIACLNVV